MTIGSGYTEIATQVAAAQTIVPNILGTNDATEVIIEHDLVALEVSDWEAVVDGNGVLTGFKILNTDFYGKALIFRRETAIEQQRDYRNGESLNLEDLEQGFDDSAKWSQEARERLKRAEKSLKNDKAQIASDRKAAEEAVERLLNEESGLPSKVDKVAGERLVTAVEQAKLANVPSDTNSELATLNQFITAINTLLTSDDISLDELQEIVDFIKVNKSTLDTLGIGNIAGLQSALDNLQSAVNSKASMVHDHHDLDIRCNNSLLGMDLYEILNNLDTALADLSDNKVHTNLLPEGFDTSTTSIRIVTDVELDDLRAEKVDKESEITVLDDVDSDHTIDYADGIAQVVNISGSAVLSFTGFPVNKSAAILLNVNLADGGAVAFSGVTVKGQSELTANAVNRLLVEQVPSIFSGNSVTDWEVVVTNLGVI